MKKDKNGVRIKELSRGHYFLQKSLQDVQFKDQNLPKSNDHQSFEKEKNQSSLNLPQKIDSEPGINKGDWTIAQNLRYMKFLCKYKKDMESHQARRSKKIFTLMQQAVCSRTTNQCRSHHQKYTLKFYSIDLIIEFIKLMAKKVNLQLEMKNSAQKKTQQNSRNSDSDLFVTLQNSKIKIQLGIENIPCWRQKFNEKIQ